MIGHPLPFETAKRERLAAAARYASETLIVGERLKDAIRDSLRFAVVEAHLLYIEGEYSLAIEGCVEAALNAALRSHSEAEIANAIEDACLAIIDNRMQLLASSHIEPQPDPNGGRCHPQRP